MGISELSGQPVSPRDPATLVGVFQILRPDVEPLRQLFLGLDRGLLVYERLAKVYQIAGDSRRPDGMKDAFFLVRQPPRLDPTMLREAASGFFRSLANLAFEQSQQELSDQLTPTPELRILEGKAPKHPRLESEKSPLMVAVIQQSPQLTEALIQRSPLASFLARAFYFLACDAFLRDYLLWPLLEQESNLDDPFADYFFLWKHGVKIRVFSEKRIDLYIPE